MPSYTTSPTTAGNFNLTAPSLCRDYGNNSYNGTNTDLSGNARVINSIIDLGPYEFENSTVPDLTTTAITSITVSSAATGGNITSDHGQAVTESGVVYSDSFGPDIDDVNDTKIVNDPLVTSGSFAASLTGLDVNTRYYVRAYAVNSLGVGYGGERSFCTLANTPGAPTVSVIDSTQANVSINANGNPSNTEYAIFEANTSKYVQTNGTIISNPVWQTETAWETSCSNTCKLVTGLIPGAAQYFQVKARNGAVSHVETAFSGGTSVITWPSVPNSFAFSNTALTSFDISIGHTNNASAVVYAIYSTTEEQYLQSDGSYGDVPVWQTKASWNATPISGMDVNTPHNFKAKAKNSDTPPVETDFGATITKYTFAKTPGTPVVDDATSSSLNIGLDGNGNPSYTQFAIQETDGSGRYVQLDGTLGAHGRNPVWQTEAQWETAVGNTRTIVTGLSPLTSYTFRVIARNNDDTPILSSFSETATLLTLQGAPTTPTEQATDITRISETSSSMTFSWTRGYASKCVAFMKEGVNTGSQACTDYKTYTASADWDLPGSEIGDGWFCIYNGADANPSVTVTNLADGEIYQIEVFEYNGNAGEQRYLCDEAENNPKTLSTLSLSVFLSLGYSSGEGNNPDNKYWGIRSFNDIDDAINNSAPGSTITFKSFGSYDYFDIDEINTNNNQFAVDDAYLLIYNGIIGNGLIQVTGSAYLVMFSNGDGDPLTLPITDGINNYTCTISNTSYKQFGIKLNPKSSTGAKSNMLWDILGDENLNATITFRIDKSAIESNIIKATDKIRYHDGMKYIEKPSESVTITEYDTYYEIIVSGVNKF